jgi:YVTN family beta-propeller protein
MPRFPGQTIGAAAEPRPSGPARPAIQGLLPFRVRRRAAIVAGCVAVALTPALAADGSGAAGVTAWSAAGRPAAGARPALVYVANLISGTVSRINTGTRQPLAPVGLGRRSGPWALAATPDGKTVYVADYGTSTITPVSTRSGRPGTPIKVPRDPDELAMAPDGKTLWVASEINDNDQAPGRITPIRVATGKAGRPVRVGLDPGPLVVSPDSKTVYAGTMGFSSQMDNGNVTVIGGRADRIRRIVRLGTRSPVSMVLAAAGQILYVGTDNGVLVPIRVSARRPGRAIRLGGFPQALVTSSRGRMVYAVSGERVIAVSARARSVAWSARIGGDPQNLALMPGGRTLYVITDPSDARPDYVTPVSTASGAIGRRIQVGRYASYLAFGPGGRTLYVLNVPQRMVGDRLEFGIGSVTPVTTATNMPGPAITVGRAPMAVLIAR